MKLKQNRVNKRLKHIIKSVSIVGMSSALFASNLAFSKEIPVKPYTVKESSFSQTLSAGKFLLPAQDGWWNWGMAPIYDEEGKLHIFNSSIPYKGKKGWGYWLTKCTIVHYVADSIEGPFVRKETAFSSDSATYCNPQVSKVDDGYVMVYLTNAEPNTKHQAVGIATAKSLNGPWTESPHNPVIKPTPNTVHAVHASNPTFVKDKDGKYRIYYKSMTENPGFRELSVAIADDIAGPYSNHPSSPVISYKAIQRDIEDPYVFFYQDNYYMLLEDRLDVVAGLAGVKATPDVKAGGWRPGLIYKSKDGFNWGLPEIGFGSDTDYFDKKGSRTERPHILFKDGKPAYLFLTSADTVEAGFYLKIGDWQP